MVLIVLQEVVRHLYIIQMNLDLLKCTRRQFFDALADKGIICNVHYIPVYYHPYYRQLGYEKGICPVAERVYEGILSLPLYYSLTDEDVERVITAVKETVSRFVV